MTKRWLVLLAASVVFYCIYSPTLFFWLLFSAVSIWLGGLRIGSNNYHLKEMLKTDPEMTRDQKRRLKKENEKNNLRIAWMIGGLNLIIWLVFKFADMSVATWNQWFRTEFRLPGLLLPLGISFYTLQAVSYVLDAANEKITPQKNFLKLLLWLSFFPQIIQGPICRYEETSEQLITGHPFDYRRVKFGAQLMLWGYFKKLVIADRAAQMSMKVFSDSASYSGLEFIAAALAYTIQIYGDFSGGMDIIGGAAQMLGIEMPVNFERPYFSRSIAEYWRRWHITLGAWFRDYIFYPLSTSKPALYIGKYTRKWFGPKAGKMIPTYLAMILVWTANGIWHGAGMQYAAFGFYQGILMILGMQTSPFTDRLLRKWNVNTECFSWRLWQMVRTFFLVVWGRIFFKASSLPEAFRIMGSVFRDVDPFIFTNGRIFELGLDQHEMFVLFLAVQVLFLVSLLKERGFRLRESLEKQNLVFRWLVYFAAIFTIILAGAYGTNYNPADFVYANF